MMMVEVNIARSRSGERCSSLGKGLGACTGHDIKSNSSQQCEVTISSDTALLIIHITSVLFHNIIYSAITNVHL